MSSCGMSRISVIWSHRIGHFGSRCERGWVAPGKWVSLRFGTIAIGLSIVVLAVGLAIAGSSL